ncbi:MAG: MFS transporter [Rhodothermales bacterium]|nr:MFS transporter [Rhodothermales bacterium]
MQTPTVATKPRLSFWQIWNMSFGFLGIQFGFALQNANVSRIFETLGASIDAIPILWIAAPVTGLVVQPIVGHLSDRTWNRLGRRRPYFLVGAVLASAALVIMPNSPVLWVAAGMLWIMDASINVSMEPFRALVADLLPSDQRTLGFAVQSFFIGTGAVVASALPYILTNWLGVSNTAAPGEIPASVTYSFYLGALAFIGAVGWTVLRTREYSPEELAAFQQAEAATMREREARAPISRTHFLRHGLVWLSLGLVLTVVLFGAETDKELYIFSVGIGVFGLFLLAAGWLTRGTGREHGLAEVATDMFRMPKTMKQLAVVQFFSWFALFSMWIYTTPAVTQHIYGTSDTTSALYNEGANWVGILFAAYNGFAAVTAFLLPWLAGRTSRKTVHLISLVAGGLGLASFYLIRDPQLLLVSELGIGLAWASILSMPYAILAGSLPAEKMGVYMGIFNFFIVIPQITAAAILGFMVRTFFGGEAIFALLVGGAAMILAGVLVMFVDDVDE